MFSNSRVLMVGILLTAGTIGAGRDVWSEATHQSLSMPPAAMQIQDAVEQS